VPQHSAAGEEARALGAPLLLLLNIISHHQPSHILAVPAPPAAAQPCQAAA
jgi:hypothetical protein